MNRRIAFKNLGMALAAAWLLPSCVGDPKKVSVALNNLQITPEEEELLANIADVIIPATDSPGAKDLYAHLFTLIMVDDCLPKVEQEKYLKGLRSFDGIIKTVGGKAFHKATSEERLKILSVIEDDLNKLPEECKHFYSITRRYILQGYLTSQHFLTAVKPYHLIPGPHYKGCIPADNYQ